MAKSRSATKKTTSRPAKKAARTSSAKPKSAKKISLSPARQTGFTLTNEEFEQALIVGEKASLAETYFGEADYAEIKQLLDQVRTRGTRARRGRVLILPGIMGSKLGIPGFLWDDVLWVDLVDIALGRIKTLKLPDRANIKPLGAILLFYLKLKLRLQVAGYDADFYAYDWRRDLSTLGANLKRHLASKEKQPVHLVAHSMGGLVSRAAIKLGAPNVGRLIMLGTPNYGSFAPTQALRGTYSVVQYVALGNQTKAEQLASQVFNTFPGLYQLLPAPEKLSGGLDLYDLNVWPSKGPRPLDKLLKVANKTQSLLAPPADNFFLIAGVNQKTVVGAKVINDEFQYTYAFDGDGTVPLEFAKLPSVPTYYVEENHGSLPNNQKATQAVIDLIADGTTQALTTEPPARRSRAASSVSEAQLRQASPDIPQDEPLSLGSFRKMMEPLAATESSDSIDTTQPHAPGALKLSSLRNLNVFRRDRHRVDIRLARGSITEVDSRAVVLGVFRDVRPSGAALAMDQRMGGAIGDISQRRMFACNVGEVFILPTGRHPVRPESVMFAGLGAFDRFNFDVLTIVAENVIRTLVRSDVEDVATVLVGTGTGQEIGEVLAHMLEGFFRGLLDADKQHRFRRITLCEYDDERFDQIRSELWRISSTPLFDDIEVTFDEIDLPLPMEVPEATRRAFAVGPDPVYLVVRGEATATGSKRFRSAVLGAGQKAAVVDGAVELKESDLKAQLAKVSPDAIGAGRFRFQDVAPLGRWLVDHLLPEKIRDAIQSLPDRHLVVVHDAEASRIPWETLHFGQHVPSLVGGMSRRYLTDNLSVAKWLDSRREDREFNVLLVVNPTLDLPGAEEEGNRLLEVLQSNRDVNVVERRGLDAKRGTLLDDFRSGKFDVIHYAGHAFFDQLNPSRSGIICAGEEILSGADLAVLGDLPHLAVFNACEAGRVRARPRNGVKPKPRARGVESAVGLAEAFLTGGICNYVGTYWPVSDAGAKTFAETFYGGLLNGKSIGDAIQTGRSKILGEKQYDWANYILYGSQDFVLKLTV